MTYEQWRDALWAALAQEFGCDGTIVNDDQRQFGDWIVTLEAAPQSRLNVTYSEALVIPPPDALEQGVRQFQVDTDPTLAAKEFADEIKAVNSKRRFRS